MAQEQDTSFASLLTSALNDVRDLFRQEVALAKYEVRQELTRAATAAAAFVGAGVAGLLAAVFLLTALARGVAGLVNWPIWSGFLAVGGLLAIVAGGLVVVARGRLKRVRLVPPQTAATVKENVEWLKRQTKSGPG